jgi:RNA polymerase sigma factor (sigma-70 family)
LPKLGRLEIRGERATPILLGYVGTVIRNLANRRLREYVRDGRAREKGEGGAALPPEITSASKVAIVREEAQAVERCLEQLSEGEREIIILRAVEGHSNREVAEDLGLDPKAASKRYRRALGRLRGQLGDSVFSELAGPDDEDSAS